MNVGKSNARTNQAVLPLISIITVVLNGEKFIEETIRSVLEQDYNSIQYIIIDGGSTDLTLKKINKYRNKIDILISEKDDGIYDAMNKGIEFAKGKWVGFLNAGDYYEKNVISKAISLLEESPKAEILHASNNYISSDKNLLHTHTPSNYKNRMIPHPSTITKRVLFEKFGKYDTSFKIAADQIYYLVTTKSANKVFSQMVLTNMRNDGASSKFKVVIGKEFYYLFRKLGNSILFSFYKAYITPIIKHIMTMMFGNLITERLNLIIKKDLNLK